MGTQVYDYSDVPTLRRFALSDARQRIVMGPFGCLDGATEFLSPDGWIRIDQWENQPIAQYDATERKISFCSPVRYINELNTEPMYHFQSRGLDMVLTPNHRVLFIKKFNPEKLQVLPAQVVFEKHHKLASGWDGMIPAAFDSDGQEGINLTDDELRLMVAVCADGYFPKGSNPNKCIICIRRPRKRERLISMLTRMKVPFDIKGSEARPTEFRYTFEAPERNKTLTKYWHANKHQLEIILDEMIHWDGCKENTYGTRIFSTTKKPDADFMQYVFACHNIRASISRIRQEAGQKDCYNVIENQSVPFVGMRHDKQKPLAEKVQVDRQYCFETETGFFVARRNNKIFVTGNSGKSAACVNEIVRRGHLQKPSTLDGIRKTRWAVIRGTFGQLTDTTMKTFYDWFPPSKYGFEQVAKHNYIITGFDGIKIEVFFRAMDRPDQVDNLLSLELTGAWANELREIPKEIWEAVDGRIFRYPSVREGGPTWCGIIGDTNPPNEGSWLHELVEKTKPSNLEFFRQPGGREHNAENLTHLLPPNGGYYRDLAIGKSPEFVNVYIDGNYGFTMKGVPVYQLTYSDSLHCAKQVIQPNKSLPLVTGWDFYLHPAVVLGQLTPRGQFVILDELMGSGMGVDRFIEQMVEPLLYDKYRGMSVVGYGDPTGKVRSSTDETTCYDSLKKHNFHWVKECHTNAPLARIGAVEYYLTRLVDNGQPGFLLSPNCQMLREGFNGGYRRKDDGTIDKGSYSHLHDGLQYSCLYTLWKHNRAAANALPTKRNRTNHVPASSAGY